MGQRDTGRTRIEHIFVDTCDQCRKDIGSMDPSYQLSIRNPAAYPEDYEESRIVCSRACLTEFVAAMADPGFFWIP